MAWKTKGYSFWKTVLKKGIVPILLFAIPFFVTSYPDVANLTIGAVLNMLRDYIQRNWIK